MTTYVFGEIPGSGVGTPYADRNAAMRAGVHQVNMAGIAGNRRVGCVSICVNAGYEDDEDHGDWIIYTGEGGNDPATKKQTSHQSLDSSGNAALVVSRENGYPVRVLRGHRGDPAYSPASGFRYDGLYRVTQHWSEIGKSGFRIWRYRLEALDTAQANEFVPAVPPVKVSAKPKGNPTPASSPGTVQRLVRNSRVTDWVKRLNQYQCQVCGIHLALPVGQYAEGAHIVALGAPHNGPDVVENVLCLCPTHHVLLDYGGIFIDDDWIVRSHTGQSLGPLTRKPSHGLDLGYVRAHRARFAF